MTASNSSGDYLLVAIDVAKRTHDVLVRWPSGRSQDFRDSTGGRALGDSPANGPEDVRRRAEEIRSSLSDLKSGDGTARRLAEDMFRHIALKTI